MRGEYWLPYRLQYLVQRFPERYQLTWGGLRRKPEEDKKVRKMKALQRRVLAAAKELGLDFPGLTS